MQNPEAYRIYAIRYGHHDRRASENFIGGDAHDGPMPLDYFVWAIVGRDRVFVLDTGFDPEMAQQRKRTLLRDPGEGLKAVGIDPQAVEDVIISHMHYDHAGNHDLFPRARYHLQDTEMAYCTGRHMCHGAIAHPYDAKDVSAMVTKLFAGRVQFHDGTDELAPGLSVHHVGGHTRGLQVVRAFTERGWVVLASDATHFYANLEQARPFPVVYNVADMLEGHRTMLRLAGSRDRVVPGHDPKVLERYPAASPETAGEIARLDLTPKN